MDKLLRTLPYERINEQGGVDRSILNVRQYISFIAFQGWVQVALDRRAAESKQSSEQALARMGEGAPCEG